ncbi:uncharacterized protein N7459_008892 [Penicillium hispanicum]|uniref:uncharacterized protein n=1 Tax=Penicillium hispanicum TaxID=1080232 RepID=UPI0025421C29|nr:uncharacterized protein N7459_008892 [Penicillium hispanicum]KAJ5569462.1 hypothetical protein N7459_008892 [Penicillium hispanicum]
MPRAHDSYQRRARAVCVRCHRRKVRCDLENRPGGVCTRCQSEGHECEVHVGPRKQKKLRTSLGASLATPSRPASSPRPAIRTHHQHETPSPFEILGHHSHRGSNLNNVTGHGPNLINGSDLVLEISQASLLPSRAHTQALADVYFRELFPFVPVIDRGQFGAESSLLLKQSLCLAGSTLRQSPGPPEWSPSAIFGRLKTLVFLHHDPDPLNILSAVCILSSWLPYAPEAVLLDNPWQWAGMGIRFGLQMQLHYEETYARSEHPGRLRRIWWYLFVNDTMQMACSGLPGMFPLIQSRIALPSLADFDNPDTGARVFCEMTTLCRILREILELGQMDNAQPYQVNSCMGRLTRWREQLPPELQLYDRDKTSRRPYNHHVNEAHIFYLVTIILICFLGRHHSSLLFKYVSMTASSCIARLYEEIACHEDAVYLNSMHAWVILVAAISRSFSDSELLNPELDEEIKISHQILEKMCEKHTAAAMVLNRLNATGHVSGTEITAQVDTMWNSLPAPISDEERQYMLSLFHFPSQFCSMLNLLQSAESRANHQQSTIEYNDDDWPVDWSSFLFDGMDVWEEA